MKMKNLRKLLALSLALTLCVGALAACGNEPEPVLAESAAPVESAPPAADKDSVLVVACDPGLEGRFSPFFAQSAADQDVVDMFTVSTLTLDRTGNPVNHGIEGEVRPYNGTDYSYKGAGDISVTENEDGTVSYDLTIRDDIRFSDGSAATIDDVIFGMYVLLDPTYDGGATLYSVPIKGLAEYRAGTEYLYTLLLKAGRNNADFTFWDEAVQREFWEADLPAAGEAWAQSIVDYCVLNGYCAEDDPVEAGAAAWGYELPEGASAGDFFEAMVDRHDDDYIAADQAESAGNPLFRFLDEKYLVGLAVEDSADYISGIEKTGDYSLRVTTSRPDATAIYQLQLPIAPMAYYGDAGLYDYNRHSFGFHKGDLSIVRAKNSAPMGAGPFVFESRSDGLVSMTANPDYYLGAPKIQRLKLKETSGDEKIGGIVQGTLDISAPDYSVEVAKRIAAENGFTEDQWDTLQGPVLTTALVDFPGYGYVGINPNLVKVGEDPYSEQSKALRKALATVISVYREESVSAYFGPAASVINYPISNTSWAAPQASDGSYRLAYSTDASGAPIYADGMTAEDKYAAALQAALGYFEAAGYTVEDGQIIAAPRGAKLEYQVNIGAGGTGDSPCFSMLTEAAQALADLGFTLTVNDMADIDALYASFQDGAAELWCGAWQSAADPDMFQLYHSDGPANYYQLSDPSLDELIMAARESADQSHRKALYKTAMELIMDCAVEVPVYQRADCLLFSSQRVDIDALPGDMSPYWGWASAIEAIETR